MSDRYPAEQAAAACLSQALFNYHDSSADPQIFGVPHAFSGSFLPALLGREILEAPTVICIIGVPIRTLRKAIELSNEEQEEDGLVQLTLQSQKGFHCVWYRTYVWCVRIDVYEAGEYGPRTLSFSTNDQTGDPPTLMQLAGLLFISLTEYVRAVVRTLRGEEDEKNLLFVLETFPSHVDLSRTNDDLDHFALLYPDAQATVENFKRFWEAVDE